MNKQRPVAVPKAKKQKEGDGYDYINICISGKTELGQMLAPFYNSAFKHPYFGPFNCMEGFWHYVKTEEKDDRLRALSGSDARKLGKKLTRHYIKNFHEVINAANFFKIEQNEKLKKLFIESELPFEYYYLFGEGQVQIRPTGWQWMIQGFTEIREMMKEGRRPADIDYSQLSNKG